MKELLKKYRRDLHRIPELGYAEFKTHAYIMDILRDCSCEVTEFQPTGVAAFFKTKNSNAKGAIAFRSDMDALLIEEANRIPYRSTHPGVMHACGHDGHMAILLGLAKLLDERVIEMPVDVLLIFQPAEESPGGAKAIADTGILEKYDVKRIFALHLGPSNDPGVIMARPNEMMARSSELTISISGKSAHIATPGKGVDSLYIGSLLVNALYEMEKSVFPAEVFRLLRFGKMTAGSVRNTIACHALLEGTLRTFKDEDFKVLYDEIQRHSKDFERKHNCGIEIHTTDGYPAILNDPLLFQMAKKALSTDEQPIVPEFITLRKPPMTSDDFSYYMKKVPGLYMFLGTGNKMPLHSNDFDFNDDVLEVGVMVYEKLLRLPI